MATNYYTDNPEWKWLFKNAINWDKIIPLYYPEYPTVDGFNNQEEVIDFLEEMLGATGEWAGSAVKDRAKHLDENGAGKVVDGYTIPGKELQAFYDEAKELQIYGLSAPTEFGGMGAPAVLNLMVFEQINKACLSSGTQLAFFTSMIDMVERFCDDEDKAKLLPKIIAGDISGSMCLTEPGAGSDLGSIQTKALPLEDGTYSLTGSKLFITNGGGGFGFVLAKLPDAPEGLAGISLFICEQDIEVNGEKKQNYIIAKNEDKMGLHGSFTCEVVYDKSVAKLIGKPHHGFRYMLHLMNEARVAVGMQSLGGIEGCLEYAKNYAKDRVQFGKTLMEHPLYARNMKDWETERDGFRALMVDTISHFDIYQRYDMLKRHGKELSAHEEKDFREAQKWVRRRTPLVKMYGAEAYTHLSQRAIQALGGYGFINEYEVGRYHRDSFATLLYEGTSQIQSLMAMKDLMKFIMRNPAKYFTGLVNANPIANFFGASSEEESKFNAVQYDFKKNFVKLLVKRLKPDANISDPKEAKKFFNAKEWLKEENIEKLMVHAETIAQGLSYIEALRVLAKHAQIDNSRSELFNKYYKLVAPRFSSIFEDWRLY